MEILDEAIGLFPKVFSDNALLRELQTLKGSTLATSIEGDSMDINTHPSWQPTLAELLKLVQKFALACADMEAQQITCFERLHGPRSFYGKRWEDRKKRIGAPDLRFLLYMLKLIRRDLRDLGTPRPLQRSTAKLARAWRLRIKGSLYTLDASDEVYRLARTQMHEFFIEAQMDEPPVLDGK